MAVPAAVNSLWQIKTVGRVEGQETNNVLHFSCVGASSDVLVHLVQVFADCFIDNLLPVLSSAWTLEKFTYQQVSAPLGPQFSFTPTGTLTGGGNASALPSYASLVIAIHTALGGKDHRGRMYIAGIPENATLNSVADTSAAFWIAAVAFCACLASNFFHPDPAGGTDLFDIGVYSRKNGGASFPFNPTGFTAANELVPVQVLGTTRSRKLGHGV